MDLVLEFLQPGLDSGLRPPILRQQVAALNSVLYHSTKVNLSYRPHICQFLNFFSANKSEFPTWKLNVVLNALTVHPFKPVRDIYLKLLHMKTIFLIDITSARRVSEIGALSSDPRLCVFQKVKVVLKPDPSFVPKMVSRFHVSHFHRSVQNQHIHWSDAATPWTFEELSKPS